LIHFVCFIHSHSHIFLQCAITSELIQVEEVLNEMKRNKRLLQMQLKRVVEKETRANSTRKLQPLVIRNYLFKFPPQTLVDLLETRIDTIGQESRSFEKHVRSIKGNFIAFFVLLFPNRTHIYNLQLIRPFD
jgi:hypothetical protein